MTAIKGFFCKNQWIAFWAAALILLPALASAVDRTPKISLTGAILPTTPSRVTVADIETLPLSSYATYNPFEKKKNRYTGILLRDLATNYATPGCTRMVFTANDGYRVEFVKDEWTRWDILMATQTNGMHMEVSSSGPAKIVMPYDTAPDINREIYTPKWIWLIKSIEFKTE